VHFYRALIFHAPINELIALIIFLIWPVRMLYISQKLDSSEDKEELQQSVKKPIVISVLEKVSEKCTYKLKLRIFRLVSRTFLIAAERNKKNTKIDFSA